jgi:hypothetical protein
MNKPPSNIQPVITLEIFKKCIRILDKMFTTFWDFEAKSHTYLTEGALHH